MNRLCCGHKKNKCYFSAWKKKKRKEKKEREWEREELVHCDRLCQMGQNPFWNFI